MKGLEGGKASVIWTAYQNPMQTNYANPNAINQGITKSDYPYCKVRYKQNVNPSEICSQLKINQEEVKIIIETLIRHDDSYTDYNGKKFSHKEALGFYLISPKYLAQSSYYTFFHSVAIFTPQPGLFSENAPQ